MIDFIKGKLIEKAKTHAVIDSNGVGYRLAISLTTAEALPLESSETKLYAILLFRQDALSLFGFADRAEREAFELLTAVSGVGPKSALAILSSLSVQELQSHISMGNPLAFKKISGIGPKTAERIILELRDKVKSPDLTALIPTGSNRLIIEEAAAALVSLGYSRQTADKCIRQILEDNPGEITAEFLIKKALQIQSK
ncbi:MAG: Holliday junction branch migration protein RuvA [Chloroflexota bacterium]